MGASAAADAHFCVNPMVAAFLKLCKQATIVNGFACLFPLEIHALPIREQFVLTRCLHKYSGTDGDERSALSPAPRAS
jgi:hypothetical protein